MDYLRKVQVKVANEKKSSNYWRLNLMLKINVGALEVTWGTIASHLAINCGQRDEKVQQNFSFPQKDTYLFRETSLFVASFVLFFFKHSINQATFPVEGL